MTSDTQLALMDSYSTAGALGIGLPIRSTPGLGTTVTAIKWASAARQGFRVDDKAATDGLELAPLAT